MFRRNQCSLFFVAFVAKVKMLGVSFCLSLREMMKRKEEEKES
jgi:hypothetical protein